jgi:transposase
MPRFVNIDRDTPMLLPADMRDWIPADHLVHFIIDAIESIDTSLAQINQRGTGSKQFPPAMLLSLLVYSYSTGIFSSRKIERSSHTDIVVRYLCANTHPDHDTLCTFRQKNGPLLQRAFAQVLEMAARCGVLKVGQVTVAIDGTKVLANASKHSAVSHGHAEQKLQELELEIQELLAKAEQADATPLQDGLTIPEEIQRRQERQAALRRAKAEIEARAYARFQAESAEHEAKMERRQALIDNGEKPRGRAPQAPSPTPDAKDQVNLTDEESRIMKTKDGFQQTYNAQAGVETDSRLIVGNRVSQSPNDKQELEPDLQEVQKNVTPAQALVDNGFASQSAIEKIEAANPGLQILAAIERQPHGRTIRQLENHPEPAPPGADASFAQKMKHRTSTAAGRALYKLRQQTVEPVFGIIKQAMGFRRFSMRGLTKVSLEWNLVCLAYNLKRLHILGAKLRAA